MNPPPLAITVLNRYDLLRAQLASLAQGTVKPPRILILDNGGRFGEAIQSELMPLWDRTAVMGTDEERALARSWNHALRWGFTNHPAVVIANDDLLWGKTSYRALTEGIRYGEPDMATTQNVGGFVCFALTRPIVHKVGEFDERFFPAYFEDEDYRYRMKLAGLFPRSVDGCCIEHVESATIQAMPPDQKEIFKLHFQKNLGLYRQKWGGVVGEETYSQPAL
jgi:hypothetical protein